MEALERLRGHLRKALASQAPGSGVEKGAVGDKSDRNGYIGYKPGQLPVSFELALSRWGPGPLLHGTQSSDATVGQLSGSEEEKVRQGGLGEDGARAARASAATSLRDNNGQQHPVPTDAFQNDEWILRSLDGNQNATAIEQRAVEHVAAQSLALLQERREAAARARNERIAELKRMQTSFAEAVKRSQQSAHLSTSLYQRRRELQMQTAKRRLQELLFECVGEIEKACSRASVKALELSAGSDDHITKCCDAMRWQHFLVRVHAESPSLRNTQMMIVNPSSSSNDLVEFLELARICKPQIQSALASAASREFNRDTMLRPPQQSLAGRLPLSVPALGNAFSVDIVQMIRIRCNAEEWVESLPTELQREVLTVSVGGESGGKASASSSTSRRGAVASTVDGVHELLYRRATFVLASAALHGSGMLATTRAKYFKKARAALAKGKKSSKADSLRGHGDHDIPLFPAYMPITSKSIEWILAFENSFRKERCEYLRAKRLQEEEMFGAVNSGLVHSLRGSTREAVDSFHEGPSPSESLSHERVGLGVDVGFDSRLYFCVEERACVRGTWRRRQQAAVEGGATAPLVGSIVSEALLEGYEHVYASEDMLRVAIAAEEGGQEGKEAEEETEKEKEKVEDSFSAREVFAKAKHALMLALFAIARNENIETDAMRKARASHRTGRLAEIFSVVSKSGLHRGERGMDAAVSAFRNLCDEHTNIAPGSASMIEAEENLRSLVDSSPDVLVVTPRRWALEAAGLYLRQTGIDKGINADALHQVVAGEPSLVLHLAAASVQSVLETSSSTGNEGFEYGLGTLPSRARASLLEHYSALTIMHGAFSTLYAASAPSTRIETGLDSHSSAEEEEEAGGSSSRVLAAGACALDGASMSELWKIYGSESGQEQRNANGDVNCPSSMLVHWDAGSSDAEGNFAKAYILVRDSPATPICAYDEKEDYASKTSAYNRDGSVRSGSSSHRSNYADRSIHGSLMNIEGDGMGARESPGGSGLGSSIADKNTPTLALLLCVEVRPGEDVGVVEETPLDPSDIEITYKCKGIEETLSSLGSKPSKKRKTQTEAMVASAAIGGFCCWRACLNPVSTPLCSPCSPSSSSSSPASSSKGGTKSPTPTSSRRSGSSRSASRRDLNSSTGSSSSSSSSNGSVKTAKLEKYPLCPLHRDIAFFLRESGKGDEVTRHLPSRKRPDKSEYANVDAGLMTGNGVFVTIRDSSALLFELATRKLSDTVRAFARRAASNAHEKHRCHREQGALKRAYDAVPGFAGLYKASKGMSSSSDGVKSAGTPTVSILGQARAQRSIAEAERLSEQFRRDIELSRKVQGTESAVSTELRTICRLGVFPTEDLAAIRAEYRELDRERALLARQSGASGADAVSNSLGRPQSSSGGRGQGSSGRRDRSRSESSKDLRQGVRRTEGELELEFCSRKLRILRRRRELLEGSFAAIGSGSSAQGSVGVDRDGFGLAVARGGQQAPASATAADVKFDERGYPMPISRGGSRQLGSRQVVARNKAERRLQRARTFGQEQQRVASRGPSPYASSRRR